MSAKRIPIRSKSSSDEKLISFMEKFYIKLPENILEKAMDKLNRDARKKIEKVNTMEKKILVALKYDSGKFTSQVHEFQCGSMLISPEASYEEIMASYNGENCIMNTILIFKKFCDGELSLKTIDDFMKSEQFNRTLADNYNNYEETDENDDSAEEGQEVIIEEPETEESEPDEKTIFLPEADILSSEIITVPEVSEEVPVVTESPVIVLEDTILNVPEKAPEKTETVTSKKKSKEKVTSYYIGYIKKYRTYFNFAPQYRLEVSASKKELIELRNVSVTFPPNGTVNLSYELNKNSHRMLENLDLQYNYAVSFSEEQLEKNVTDTGDIQKDVNLKIDLEKAFVANRNATTFFRKIEDFRIYRIAEPEDFSDSTIIISDDFAKGEWILVRSKNGSDIMEKGEISGPYRVYKDNEKTYIQPKLSNERYMITCYRENGLDFGISERQEIANDPVCIPFVLVKDGASYKKDVIPDEILIKSMFAETSKDFFSLIKKSPDEFVKLLGNSSFLSKTIPDAIKAGRLARIRSLFADIKNYTNEQKHIAKTLLEAYSSDGEIRESLTEIIKSSQEFRDLQKELEKKAKAVKPSRAEAKLIEAESAKAKAIAEKCTEVEELERKISELREQYEIFGSYGDILKDIEYQKGIRAFLSEENSRLQHRNNDIKRKIKSTITEQANEVGIAFDPYISSAMLDAASQWNRKQETEIYSNAVSVIMQKTADCRHMDKKKLIDYLVSYVKQYRNYSTNDIINMYICITQGFLTVFSGLPGTGKTSVCNIIGNSLGLTDFGSDDINYNRFVPVSVEKGWSSKKDLIGYYNPLTKKYDKNNRRLYDSLMILNEEKDNSQFPYIVLLDEANLSPMEYYWADFMQIADKADSGEAYVNIGLEDDIYVPDTLRFVATINNDQTTETLSPRLLDRAWIIKLPDSDIIEEVPRPAEKIFWKDLSEAFNSVSNKNIGCQSLLDQIFKAFQGFGMAVSPRIQLSMRRYIISAREVMESVNGVSPEYIAVDYAVMQRLLPKINGYMKLYKELFEKLIYICNTYHLDMTKNALEEMKRNSLRNMGYCQYLS